MKTKFALLGLFGLGFVSFFLPFCNIYCELIEPYIKTLLVHILIMTYVILYILISGRCHVVPVAGVCIGLDQPGQAEGRLSFFSQLHAALDKSA